MVNLKVCVTVCVVIILVLFVVFAFLMSTVNPDPLAPPPVKVDPVEPPLLPSNLSRTKTFAEKFYKKEAVLFPEPDDGLGYGLEKALESDIAKHGEELAKIIPLYRQLAKQGSLANGSIFKEIVSPIYPPYKNKTCKLKYNNTAFSVSRNPSVKGFRRSVENIESTNRIIEENSGLILKVIGDSGYPRIQIKLEPAGYYEGKRRNYRSSFNGSNNSDTLMKDFRASARSTIIKVLPNKTVIIDENKNREHASYVTDEGNNVQAKISEKLVTTIHNGNKRDYQEVTVIIALEDHKHAGMVSSANKFWNNTNMFHFNMLSNKSDTLQFTAQNVTDNNVKNNNSATFKIVSERFIKENATELAYVGKILSSNVTSTETNTLHESFAKENITDLAYDGKIIPSQITSTESNITSKKLAKENALTYDEKIITSKVMSTETNITSERFAKENDTDLANKEKNISSKITSTETNIISERFAKEKATDSAYDEQIMPSKITSIETNIIGKRFTKENATKLTYEEKIIPYKTTSTETNTIIERLAQENATDSAYTGKSMSSNVTSIETNILSERFGKENATDIEYASIENVNKSESFAKENTTGSAYGGKAM